MRSFVKYSFILFFGFSLRALAQDNPLEKNELDKNYLPDKNSIFSNGINNSSDKTIDETEIHNAIKFNPGLLVRSIGAIYYERSITEGITIQGGIGTCFSADKLLTTSANADLFLSQPKSSVRLGDMITYGHDLTGGNLFFAASFRFYYSGYYSTYESFNTGYFEIGMRHYSNTFRMDDNTPQYNNMYGSGSNGPLTTGGLISIRNNIYHITYGYELYTHGKVKTTHDFFIGVGLRNTSYDSFSSQPMYLPSSGQMVDVNVKSGRESTLFPSFIIGYAFGFGFK